MKKYLPFVFLGVAVIFVVGIIAYSKRSSTPVAYDDVVEEETAPEIPFDQRPVASLTPKADGHWLSLKLTGINRLAAATTVEYEVLYEAGDGRQQGSSGKTQISGKTSYDSDILLGSESSGKFRYDAGVEKGTLTIKYRDAKGKLAGKLMTDFHFQTGTDILTSVDNKFTYKLDKVSKKGFFLTMNTFGVPQGLDGLANGPIGLFSSETVKLPGTVTMEGSKVWLWNEASWSPTASNKAPNIGIFASTN